MSRINVDGRRMTVAEFQEAKGLTVGGYLDLSGTAITALPEGLTVGGGLYLRGMAITALPEGLTVGSYLDLSGTAITALPEGLTVGGYLDLSGTAITALPEGLTVGGGLDLSGTAITALPEGLTVGGGLDLSGDQIPLLLPHISRLGISLVAISGLAYRVQVHGTSMQCGCENHTLTNWAAFDDRRILDMDGKTALKFWREHGKNLVEIGHSLVSGPVGELAA